MFFCLGSSSSHGSVRDVWTRRSFFMLSLDFQWLTAGEWDALPASQRSSAYNMTWTPERIVLNRYCNFIFILFYFTLLGYIFAVIFVCNFLWSVHCRSVHWRRKKRKQTNHGHSVLKFHKIISNFFRLPNEHMWERSKLCYKNPISLSTLVKNEKWYFNANFTSQLELSPFGVLTNVSAGPHFSCVAVAESVLHLPIT